MGRQDTTIWTATIDGTPIGRVQRGAGGNLTASSHKSWDGGSGERERGGRKTQSNVVLARENDGNPTIAWLRSKVNRPVQIARTPADDDGNPRMSEQVTWNGKLLEVRPDDTDTMNDGDIEVWEIEIGVNTP